MAEKRAAKRDSTFLEDCEAIKMYVNMEFSDQRKTLQWVWLALNYIFWPIVLVVVVNILFWIISGFTEEKKIENQVTLRDDPHGQN